MSKKNELLNKVLGAINAAAKELDRAPQYITKLDLLTNEYGVTDWDLRKLGGLGLIKATHFPFTDKDLKGIKELKDSRSYINQLEKDLVEAQDLEKSIKDAIELLPKIKAIPFKKKKTKIKRFLNLVVSDTHFGSDIKKEETGKLDYGSVEESRRFARIVKETIEYKENHRAETELNVLLLGDIIENLLHDHADGAPITVQFARALNILSQAILHFSRAFPKVNIYCTGGNHSRILSRHKGRAITQKWDNYETMLYIALQSRFTNLSNVNFIIPKTPYIVYEVFGKKIFVTHGDTVFSVNNPSGTIKTGNLEDKINSINASLPDNEEYSVFVIGHWHVASCVHLSNGTTLITNGPLVPPNDFAISLDLFEASCGQYIFESIENYPVGDIRYIKVGEIDDNNKELNKIIKDFEWKNEKIKIN